MKKIKSLSIILILLSCFATSTVYAKTYNLFEGEDLNPGQNGEIPNVVSPDGSSTNNDDKKNDDKKDTSKEVIDAGTDYCTEEALLKPLKFIGQIIQILKIAIPLLLIVFGVIDLFRAVMSAKPEELAKSIKTLLFRAIAAVIIFFLPTIIHMIFMLVDDFMIYDNDYKKCSACLFNPKNC